MATFDKFVDENINLDAQFVADAIQERMSKLLYEKFTTSDPIKLGQSDYIAVSKQFAAIAKNEYGKVTSMLPKYLTYNEATEAYFPCLQNFAKDLKSVINFLESFFIDYMESLQTKKEWDNAGTSLMRIHKICKRRVENLKSDWGADLISDDEGNVTDED